MRVVWMRDFTRCVRRSGTVSKANCSPKTMELKKKNLIWSIICENVYKFQARYKRNVFNNNTKNMYRQYDI